MKAEPGPDHNNPSAAIPLVFLTLCLIWGTTWLVIRIGLDHYPPMFSLAMRFCVAGPVLLLIMKLRGDRIPWAPVHQPFFLLLGFLSFVCSFGIVYWGEQYVSSGLAAVIFALLPLFTGVVAHRFVKGEPLGARRLLGVVIGLGGILVINSGDLAQVHPMAPLAGSLIVIGPLVTAVSTVLSKRRVEDFPTLAFAALPMTYGGIMDLGLWWIFERHIPLGWSWPGVASIAYLTFAGSLVTFAGYFWLLKRIQVNRVNLLAYITPLVALTMGAIFRGERLTPHILAGAALVLAGVTVANRAGKTRRKLPRTPGWPGRPEVPPPIPGSGGSSDRSRDSS